MLVHPRWSKNQEPGSWAARPSAMTIPTGGGQGCGQSPAGPCGRSWWPRATWAGMQSGIWGGGHWAGGGQGQCGRWGGWHMGIVAHGDRGTAGPAGGSPCGKGAPGRVGALSPPGGAPGRAGLARDGWGAPGTVRSPRQGWGGPAAMGSSGGGGFGEPLAPAAGAGWEAGGGDKITISGRPDRAMLSGRDLQNGIF